MTTGEDVAVAADQRLPLPRIYERDIDFLLQEELVFNEHVCRLFGRITDIRGLRISHCELSVWDSGRETDVLAIFDSDHGNGILLIENKIDAAFQPGQPEAYRQRADDFVRSNRGQLAVCVLVAPRRYVSARNVDVLKIFKVVSYEDIADAIRAQDTPRARYRAQVMEHSLERAQNAYVMTPAAEIGDLWQRIFRIARTEFPQLGMTPPGEKGANSSWVIFKADLPPKITLDWKIPKGEVDLSFWPSAPLFLPADIDLGSISGVIRQRRGTTDRICFPFSTPPANWTEIADEHIRSAMRTSCKLLDFFRANRSELLKRS